MTATLKTDFSFCCNPAFNNIYQTANFLNLVIVIIILKSVSKAVEYEKENKE